MIETSEVLLSQLPYVPDYVSAGSDYLKAKVIPERASLVKEAFKKELSEAENKGARYKKMAALGAFATGIVWEWGPFNELVAIYPSLAVQEATGNVLAAGIVGGSIYAAQQALFGTTTSAAISVIPETKSEYHNQFATAEDDDEESDYSTQELKKRSRLSKIKKLADNTFLLIGLGESAAVGNRHIRDKNRTFKEDMKLVGKLTLALAAIDVAVFTTGVQLVEKTDEAGVDQSAVADTLTNPMTWILLFGGLQIASHSLKKMSQKRKQKKLITGQ
jgi:hypothetical protein